MPFSKKHKWCGSAFLEHSVEMPQLMHKPLWILGTLFFHDRLVVFDYEFRRIGIGEPIETADPKKGKNGNKGYSEVRNSATAASGRQSLDV